MTTASQQFGKLREMGDKWRQNRKAADAALERADSYFAELDLKVEILDKKSFCEYKKSCEGQLVESIYDLCYGRADDGQWGLCVRHYKHCIPPETQNTESSTEQPSLELFDVQLLADQRDEVRQKALVRLPAFLEILSGELERRNQELEKASAQVETALSQMDPATKDGSDGSQPGNGKAAESQSVKKKEHA